MGPHTTLMFPVVSGALGRNLPLCYGHSKSQHPLNEITVNKSG